MSGFCLRIQVQAGPLETAISTRQNIDAFFYSKGKIFLPVLHNIAIKYNKEKYILKAVELCYISYLRGESSNEEGISSARMVIVVHARCRVEGHQFKGGEISAHDAVRVFEIE